MARSRSSKLKRGEGDDDVTLGEPFDFWESGIRDSLTATEGAIDGLMDSIGLGILALDTLKKLPEYNVVYSVEMAYDVNTMPLKAHDTKEDDPILLADREWDNTEPVPPGRDPFSVDKMGSRTYVKEIVESEELGRSANDSKVSRTSTRKSPAGSRRRSYGLTLDLAGFTRGASGDQPTSPYGAYALSKAGSPSPYPKLLQTPQSVATSPSTKRPGKQPKEKGALI